MRPDYFPTECPPTDAVPAGGNYYRFAKNSPLIEDDFVTHWTDCRRGCRKCKGRECEACGFSVYRSLDDINEMKTVFPGFRNCFICKATITDIHGVHKSTPSNKSPNHYTLWIYPQHRTLDFFTVV